MVSTRKSLTLLAVLGGFILLGGPAEANYANCTGTKLIISATASLAAASRTHDPVAFNAILSRYADVNAIALAALGSYRRDLPAELKPRYVAKTRAFIGRVLADNAGLFARSSLDIQSCAPGEVHSKLGNRDVVWKVSGDRVSDVEIDGVWLVPEMRSKFTSIIRRSHDGIQSLFEFLDRNS